MVFGINSIGNNQSYHHTSKTPSSSQQEEGDIWSQAQKADSQNITTGLPAEKIPHLEKDKDGNLVDNYYDSSGKLVKSVPHGKPEYIKAEKPIENNINTQQDKPKNNDYLEKDKNYQRFTDKKNKLEQAMVLVETKYNVKRGDLMSELNIAAKDKELYGKYSKIKLMHDSLERDLPQYEKTMSEWQDGAYMDRIENNHGVFNNVERITLEDGQRAYKANNKIYLPGPDGQPGVEKE